ncbi:hypothetical protein HED49_14675 [Ochrobactrum daejeonense]|nr:hypothetical protein [Brucella daejeonensis]
MAFKIKQEYFSSARPGLNESGSLDRTTRSRRPRGNKFIPMISGLFYMERNNIALRNILAND